MLDLGGRVVVFSGGNAGIGLGFARGIAGAGGDAAPWGRRAEKYDEAAKSLAPLGGRAFTQRVDVSDEAQVVWAFGPKNGRLRPRRTRTELRGSS